MGVLRPELLGILEQRGVVRVEEGLHALPVPECAAEGELPGLGHGPLAGQGAKTPAHLVLRARQGGIEGAQVALVVLCRPVVVDGELREHGESAEVLTLEGEAGLVGRHVEELLQDPRRAEGGEGALHRPRR